MNYLSTDLNLDLPPHLPPAHFRSVVRVGYTWYLFFFFFSVAEPKVYFHTITFAGWGVRWLRLFVHVSSIFPKGWSVGQEPVLPAVRRKHPRCPISRRNANVIYKKNREKKMTKQNHPVFVGARDGRPSQTTLNQF